MMTKEEVLFDVSSFIKTIFPYVSICEVSDAHMVKDITNVINQVFDGKDNKTFKFTQYGKIKSQDYEKTDFILMHVQDTYDSAVYDRAILVNDVMYLYLTFMDTLCNIRVVMNHKKYYNQDSYNDTQVLVDGDYHADIVSLYGMKSFIAYTFEQMTKGPELTKGPE